MTSNGLDLGTQVAKGPMLSRSSPQSQHSQDSELEFLSASSESSVGSLGFTSHFDKRRTFRTTSESQVEEMECCRRTRSLNAPSPIQQFGPCGRIMKNSAMVMQIQDPAFQRLTWYKPPLTVLVIKKTRDLSVLDPFMHLTNWLLEKCMVVHVEAAVLEDSNLTRMADFETVRTKIQIFREGRDDLTDKIDFIICLGGDGTLLYASSLFQKSVPPIMAFHLGSLGFLTPFRFNNFQDQVNSVLQGNAGLTLRSRLQCILKRRHVPKGASGGVANGSTTNGGTTEEDHPHTLSLLVLNEVVIDRGPNPYLSNLDLFVNSEHVTVVQGDGLIVSTPTGSTAYAAAAGASMIHPSVSAMMITPICPHSLSFRPICVPAGVELEIMIAPDSRNTAWVSFDGRNRQEIKHGDTLLVRTSTYPVPCISAQDQVRDWFDSLANCLQWNVRSGQKPLLLDDDSESDTSETRDENIQAQN